MGQAVWQTEPGGSLASDVGEFRLVIERVNGWVRYQVLQRERQPGAGNPVLLASGNQDDVRAAMEAAERVAGLADAGARWPAREHAA